MKRRLGLCGTSTGSNPGSSTCGPAPCWWPGRAVKDGPSLWVPVPTWGTQRKRLVSAVAVIWRVNRAHSVRLSCLLTLSAFQIPPSLPSSLPSFLPWLCSVRDSSFTNVFRPFVPLLQACRSPHPLFEWAHPLAFLLLFWYCLVLDFPLL